MNPYIYDPKKVTTTQQANIILGYFDTEIANKTSVVVLTTEMNEAILDALSKTNPELSEQFGQLSSSSNLVGHAEQSKQDTVLMKQQFTSALPYAIKQQL